MTEKKKQKEDWKGLPLEELILDKARGKYELVLLASQWAKEVRRMEEFRHLTQVELLEKALNDAITGTIDWEKLEKIQAKNAPLFEKVEEKAKE
jgi:DNA-directed RNA polymerase subunit K/omega